MPQKRNLTLNPKPFVKWVGGKSRVLPQLFIYLPEKFNRYFEPFVGGGAFLFSLKPEKASINDTNTILMHTYKTIKEHPQKLIKLLGELEEKYKNTEVVDRKEFFLKVRSSFNDLESNIDERSAFFIFLNRTCFNGMYRENSKGGFNVPFGKYTNPLFCNENNLRKTLKALKNVEIKKQDYKEVLKKTKKGDFVYFDPPYYPVSKTASLISYAFA